MLRCEKRRATIECVGTCAIPYECIKNAAGYAATLRASEMRRFFKECVFARFFLIFAGSCITIGAIIKLLS